MLTDSVGLQPTWLNLSAQSINYPKDIYQSYSGLTAFQFDDKTHAHPAARASRKIFELASQSWTDAGKAAYIAIACRL